MLPSWLIPAILLCFSLFVLRAIWRGAQRKKRLPPEEAVKTPEGFAAAMADIAAFAVQNAKTEFGVTLNYSPKSVMKVEEILGRLHEQHARTPLTDEAIARQALRFGVYVGEVIRRKQGGQWEMAELDGFDPMAFQITYPHHDGKEGTSFPVNWCGKRIYNGPEDNVWHKFHLLVEGGGKVLTFPIQATEKDND
ncbi:hypothetical protein [Armatimonas sp.]|uniref:hypothetical protein n=1 Tax=Armatimonas sp. TaxID=1872638 RepID=UPI00374CDA04